MNRQRYQFISHDSYKNRKDDKSLTYFYQLATFPHPKNGKYHMRKFIINSKNNVHDVNDYLLDKDQYDRFLKSKKINEYKLYSVYSLNDVNYPTGGEILASKSDMLNNNFDYTGFAPFTSFNYM